jgi:FkbM family methyltransferase
MKDPRKSWTRKWGPAIVKILRLFLGRNTAWRLGRCLYLQARGDSPNKIHLDEELLQRFVISRFAGVEEKLVAFDVGANVGRWTFLFLEEALKLKMENQVEIYAFEPVPCTFSVLEEGIRKHPLGQIVHLVPKALSDTDGIAEMHITGECAVTNSLHAFQKTWPRTQIEKTTGCRYCSRNSIKIIHFLKCDAEGHDYQVLLGFKSLFDEQRVMACQFEYNHRWIYSRHYLKDVFDLFDNTPYTIGKVTLNGIELYHEWHPELERFFEGNYVVLHPAARHWFTTTTGKYDAYDTYCVQETHIADPRTAKIRLD